VSGCLVKFTPASGESALVLDFDHQNVPIATSSMNMNDYDLKSIAAYEKQLAIDSLLYVILGVLCISLCQAFRCMTLCSQTSLLLPSL
jgi:hypothetical protein